VEEAGGGILVTFSALASISEGVSEGISEGISSLMDCIKNKPGLRIPELSERLHAPAKTIERWIKKLRDQNKIIFKGAPKTGGYFINEERY
jgi:ATP-dependent DNA helicase RecG